MGAVQQVNPAQGHIFADGLVPKAAQNVPEGLPAGRQACGGCWLTELQVEDHHLQAITEHHSSMLQNTAGYRCFVTTGQICDLLVDKMSTQTQGL